jgi:hypothetical protein
VEEQERPRLPAVAGEAVETMEAIYIPPHRIVHLDLKVGFSNIMHTKNRRLISEDKIILKVTVIPR